MRKGSWSWIGALIALGACGPGGTSPNVLLVVVDTLRADHLGCYGYEQETSPNIDILAAGGVLFENAFSQAPQTLPSVCSILTGLYPQSHGVRANGFFALSPEATTLAETFREAGYQTAAFVGGFPLDRRFGLDQGFETYGDEMRWRRPMMGTTVDEQGVSWMGHHAKSFENSAEDVTSRALEWLAGGKREPFFLMVHYFDPHHDYVPPSPFDQRFEHPYDGEIAHVDLELGKLLSELERRELADRTLVVFTADHGECLGEQGRLFHQAWLTQGTVHVPLILRLPGELPAGKRVQSLVQSVDIAPTVLSLAGLAAPGAVDGLALVDLAHGRGKGAPAAYFETLYGKLESPDGHARQGVSDGRYKLLRHTREDGSGAVQEALEMFDLASDPLETRNLSHEEPERAAELSRRLDELLGREGTLAPVVLSSDPETLERLRALGYE